MAGTPARRAPYKDTLQPALHRRFSATAAFLLAVAYLEALLLVPRPSYFLFWFPLGPAGVRTLFIFACGLSILILRIANYHVDIKTTGSSGHALASALLSLKTYETGLWYGVSSLIYCHIYLGTRGDNANLGWVTYFSGDRARLNERPVFMACYMATFALLQTIRHFALDIDRLDLSSLARKSAVQHKRLGIISTPFQLALFELPLAFADCFKQALTALPLTLILYHLFLRSFAWSWTLMFLRPFYNLPRTSMLPPSWPSDIYLMSRCIVAGTGVGFVWAAGNTAFSIFMVKRPLKNGNPLTSESKDPNSSLLNGLKSKKLSIKSFAMWELAIIAQDFEARRKAIFNDIDRKDGLMWSQVYAICIEPLESIEARVDSYGKAPAPEAPQPITTEERQRSLAPLREDPIFTGQSKPTTLRSGVEKALDRLARNPGSSPASELSPLAKKTWESAKDRMLSKEQQEAMSPDQLMGQAKQLVTNLVTLGWIGDLFRQDFRTQFTASVLGAPYAEPSLHTHAAIALCQLAVHSLAEDSYGNVHRDVPSIIRTLTAVITKAEGLKTRFPLHWTDIKGAKECPEIDQLLDTMKTQLEQILAKFEPYSRDLRLTSVDLRLAKEAIAGPKEEPAKAKEVEATVEVKANDDRRAQRRVAQRREQRRPEMEQAR